MDPHTVLEFWFGAPDVDPDAQSAKWFKKDPAFDAEVRERFSSFHERIAAGELEEWRDEAASCLAYVIVLDQFSRNMFRDKPEAFASDPRALAATDGAIAAGLDEELDLAQRCFLYMPFMHAEDLDAQNRGIVAFARIVEAGDADERARWVNNLVYAVRHQKIIRRFGRFPHRNAVLGRDSTDEESAFLLQPGSSF